MILAAGTSGTIIATVAAFLLITLLLVTLLLFVKQKLSPSGPVTIMINGEREIEVASGETLLTTLGSNKIFLPSACGGGGTCIQCECHVNEGGGEALPTELPHSSGIEMFMFCFTFTWQAKRAPLFNSFLEKCGNSVGKASPPPSFT